MQADMVSIRALLDKIRIVRDEDDAQALLHELSARSMADPVRVAFVNAHALNLCYKNPDFLRDVLSCDYILRDGSGMKILYQMLGREEGLNMNGTDFIPRLLEACRGREIALMGTASPHLEKAGEKMANMGLATTLMVDGFQEDDVYKERLLGSPAKIVLLAMGMPKQERIARNIAESDRTPRLIICGGAILDFMAGKVNRAPEFFRRYGIEWIFRLAQEPKRLFKRYVVGNVVFLGHAMCLSSKIKSERRSYMKNPEAKPKILHVVRQYAPAIGGLESYVQNMVRHQRAMGHDCEVLTLNTVFHGDGAELPANEVIEGVKVRRAKFFGRRRFFIPLVSPLYFAKFDVVHVHNTDVFYDYVALIAAFTKTPCFATTHGGFFHTQDFSLIKKIYFQTVTRFSSMFYKAIFAISENDYSMFKSLNKNVILQPNAIEPMGGGIYGGADFLYIGRLADHKNVNRAIEAFSILKKSYRAPGKFHIIGPDWDISSDDLKALAEAQGVGDDVIFHGSATTERMREIAQSCGYFMSGSSFEGFGMSMLEAMSVGLVPFVHGNPSFEELVNKSGVGLLADFNDPAATAAAISAYLPGITMEDRKRAKVFSSQFSWQSLVENTSRHYRDAFQ